MSVLLTEELHVKKTSNCGTIEQPGSKCEISNQCGKTAGLWNQHSPGNTTLQTKRHILVWNHFHSPIYDWSMQGKWVAHRKIKSMMNKKEWIVMEYGEP